MLSSYQTVYFYFIFVFRQASGGTDGMDAALGKTLSETENGAPETSARRGGEVDKEQPT